MPSLECVSGPITELRLPRHAWEGLRKHGITSIDQLRAIADRLERLERIVRKELASIEFP